MPLSILRSGQRWTNALAVSGLCALLLGHASPPGLAHPILIAQSISRSPEVITGELTSTSPVLEDDGSYYEPHTFEGNAGETLAFDLTSEDFDAFLILQNPSGENIAQDDDGAGETNARITVTLPVTGTYTLLVNSCAAEETGKYRLEIRTATTEEQALAEANQLNQQVIELYQAGRYMEAIPLAERTLLIYEQALGPDHLFTAASLNNLAELYRSQGRYAEAELLHQRSLAIYEQTLSDHIDTATSLNSLAALYFSQGRYGEAELLYQRSLVIYEQTLGSEHPDIVPSLNNLALLHDSQGNYSEAEPLYQRALTIREQAPGPSHPDTATSLNNLAALYFSQGRYGEAESLYQRSLVIYEQALGPDHPTTSSSLNNLAALYDLRGRYGEAEPLYQRALAIREQALGPDHPDTATSLNNLAALYFLQGHYSEAEPLYRRALTIREQALGPDHPDTATSLNNLAALYFSQGHYSEAEPLYQRALTIGAQAFGSDHPDTAISFNNLAWLYYAQGQLQSSLTFLSRGLAVQETILSRNLVGGSDTDKRDYLAIVSGTTNGVISLHLRDLPADSAAAQLALSTILQRKGRVLDLFTNLRAQLKDDSEALELLNELNAATNQLDNLTSNPPIEFSPEAYQDQLATLQKQIRDLEDELSRRSEEFADMTTSPNVSEIQAELLDDTALVEFIRYQPLNPLGSEQERFGEPRYAAYILASDGEIQGIDLGATDAIDTAVSTLSRSLASADAPLGQVKQDAQALEKLVMTPVRQVLGDTTTVFLSPDGALNLIPFEALVDESGNHLIRNYQFRYLTSGRDLMRLDSNTPSTAPAVFVGNPTYGQFQNQAWADSDIRNRIFAALPGTQAEVDAISGQLEKSG